MHRTMVFRSAALLVSMLATFCLAIVSPANAAGNQFWVDDLPANPTGACTQMDPCSLEHGFGQLTSDDELIVNAGDYDVSAPLVANVPVTIRGIPGQVHPQIDSETGDVNPALTLNQGGTLRHIAFGASGPGQTAVKVQNALIEDFAAVSADGPALEVVGASTKTSTIRDAVFVSWSVNTGTSAVTLDGAGTVNLRNLTVWADAGPDGIDCRLAGGSGTLVNVLVRGTTYDVDARSSTKCTAKHSNFRPAKSPGLTSTTGNQSAEPIVGSTVAGDFRPRPGSPTIDAGTDDALLGATDPDSNARKLGAAVDIGAYETQNPDPPSEPTDPGTPGDSETQNPTTEPTPTPARPVTLPPVAQLPPPPPAGPRAAGPPLELPQVTPPAPVLGKSVTLGDVKGDVRIRTPKGTFVDLADAKTIPVGTVIDTRKGTITLSSKLPNGKTQSGTFNGGMFEVRQSKSSRGMTDILLRGGAFAGCPRTKAKRPAKARAAAAKKARRKGRRSTVRRLWARDKGGRFRTHGKNSVATVRGTKWLTVDRCDGTYTKVTEGAVDVKDKRTRKVRRVKAGRSILVKRRR